MEFTNQEIITENANEIYVFNKRARMLIGICPNCEKRVRLIFPLEAAEIADRSLREIFRRIEMGNLHFVETDEKVLLICFESLTESL